MELTGAALLYAAGHMHLWVPPMLCALFGVVVGSLHLWASLTFDD